MNFIAWVAFTAAALLEVGGDLVVRQGLRGRNLLFVIAGFIMLGSYGVAVNTVKWDFSKLLGVYIAFFAVTSVMIGRFALRENVPLSTWLGVALIVVGGLVIQFGRSSWSGS